MIIRSESLNLFVSQIVSIDQQRLSKNMQMQNHASYISFEKTGEGRIVRCFPLTADFMTDLEGLKS